jgi:hypothetical protein
LFAPLWDGLLNSDGLETRRVQQPVRTYLLLLKLHWKVKPEGKAGRGSSLALAPFPWQFSGGLTLAMPKKTLGIIVLILLFGFILRIPYFIHTMQDMDEGCYAGIAAILMDSGRHAPMQLKISRPAFFISINGRFLFSGKYNMLAVHGNVFLDPMHGIILSGIAYKMNGIKSFICTFVLSDVYRCPVPKMIAANSEIFMTLPILSQRWYYGS